MIVILSINILHGTEEFSTNIDKNCNQIIKGDNTQNSRNKEEDTEKHLFNEDQIQKLL